MYDSIFMKQKDQMNPQRQKRDLCLPGASGKKRWGPVMMPLWKVIKMFQNQECWVDQFVNILGKFSTTHFKRSSYAHPQEICHCKSIGDWRYSLPIQSTLNTSKVLDSIPRDSATSNLVRPGTNSLGERREECHKNTVLVIIYKDFLKGRIPSTMCVSFPPAASPGKMLQGGLRHNHPRVRNL